MSKNLRRESNSILLAIGDSIIWGQGLPDQKKFARMVQKKLKLPLVNLAHSGATVLTGPVTEISHITDPDYYTPGNRRHGTTPPTGEVPRSKPTILEQSDFYKNDPDNVRFVLMDGGINDVQITTIIDPFTNIDDLRASINQHCYREMLTLLKQVGQKFAHADQMIVTGYYRIFGKPEGPGKPGSDPAKTLRLVAGLLNHSLAFEQERKTRGRWPNDPATLSEIFWSESTDALTRAVSKAGDSRIKFVDPGFSGENALFASDSYLWDLNLDDQLSAKDPMKNARLPLCQKYEPDDCIFCPRASVGHPNPKGAKQYASAICKALGLPQGRQASRSGASN